MTTPWRRRDVNSVASPRDQSVLVPAMPKVRSPRGPTRVIGDFRHLTFGLGSKAWMRALPRILLMQYLFQALLNFRWVEAHEG